MKKVIFFLLLFLIDFIYSEVAAEPFNYYDWSNLNEQSKLMYIKSFLEGYNLAQSNIYSEIEKTYLDSSSVQFMIKHFKLKNTVDIDTTIMLMYSMVLADIENDKLVSSLTLGQYVSGIDKIYLEHLNHQIPIFELIQLISKTRYMNSDRIEPFLFTLRRKYNN